MIEVVSIKFKNRGKCYFFAPNSLEINTGDKVIVETAKGLEIADCCRGNHMVEKTAVVQPLRPVARIATKDDLRVAEYNKRREKDAFEICQKKIEEHGLDMKLVDVECNFEGNKTTFFFTSDGRVDFRELVKDLAGIFRNRIELRQIGVRDEAKMIGGIGICGRPYCCSQFLEEFQPVSTKMAKVQSLSLNPTKISGSCGRLMCCLRYEQEAYEDLIKKVPKQGAFVETKDGYGTAVQVNLLRQTVKVKLDGDDDSLRSYKPNELCAVPGGRPKDGDAPAHVLNYIPEPEEPEEKEDEWALPTLLADYGPEQPAEQPKSERRGKPRGARGRNLQKPRGERREQTEQKAEPKQKSPARKGRGGSKAKAENAPRPAHNSEKKATVKPVKVSPEGQKPQSEQRRNNRRRNYYRGKPKNGGAPKSE